MKLSDRIRADYYHWRTRLLEASYSRLPMPGLSRPVFIIGCARSGKTTLAYLLSQHPDIVYLNEPRHYWISTFPCSDIWTPKPAIRRGRLVLDARDFDPARGKRLSRLFRLRAIRSGGSVVAEELAVNCFRIPLILRIFPDARFIFVYRNGLEVARLIKDALDARGTWFGVDQYKWKQLVSHAARDPATRDLPEICKTFYDMGLLEWRLNVEAAVTEIRKLPRESYYEINSGDLFNRPENVLARIFAFVDVKSHAAITRSAAAHLREQKTPRAPGGRQPDFTEKRLRIGGPMLLESIRGAHGLIRP